MKTKQQRYKERHPDRVKDSNAKYDKSDKGKARRKKYYERKKKG